MKPLFLLTGMFALITSCSKTVDNPKVYSDAKGTSISFTTTAWTASKSTAGVGSVNLKLAGSTNADRVAVTTYGELTDGLIDDEIITLDSKKNFNATVLITYANAPAPTESFVKSTEVKVFRGDDTLKVSLTSGSLKY